MWRRITLYYTMFSLKTLLGGFTWLRNKLKRTKISFYDLLKQTRPSETALWRKQPFSASSSVNSQTGRWMWGLKEDRWRKYCFKQRREVYRFVHGGLAIIVTESSIWFKYIYVLFKSNFVEAMQNLASKFYLSISLRNEYQLPSAPINHC